MPLTLDGVVAYISGYDAALSGGFLIGFREWLITRLEYGNNLTWDGLVGEFLKIEPSCKDAGVAIERLFSLLEQFLDMRNTHNGMRRIFAEYEQWLHGQEWYTPKYPGWLKPRDG
jgi:hypothetical protein